MDKSTVTVLALSFLLLVLVFLLIVFYRKLNKEANGEYTPQRIVFKEGGLRDQARCAAFALETHLGIQLWPRNDTEEDDEMHNVEEMEDEEAEIGVCASQKGDSEENSNYSYGEENNTLQRVKKQEDYESSLESLEIGKQHPLKPEQKVTAQIEEQWDDSLIALVEEQDNVDLIRGTEFQKHLQFSGSVIWSDEGRGEVCDVTVL